MSVRHYFGLPAVIKLPVWPLILGKKLCPAQDDKQLSIRW